MKQIFLSAAVVAALAFTSCKEEAKTEETTVTTETVSTDDAAKEVAMTSSSFGVRGNCGMCKKTIEKAATGIDGVSKAVWDKDKKKIDVAFDASKTNEMAIHKAIAASGYDTEKVAGDEAAYKELPGCCQYDHSMAMNQLDAPKTNDHSDHDH